MDVLNFKLDFRLNIHLLKIYCFLKVTGGAGFVGSHLTDALMIAGHEVC